MNLAVEGEVTRWAQAELDKYGVLSIREVAWELLRKGYSDRHREIAETASSILGTLKLRKHGFMERSRYGRPEHFQLKERAYRYVATNYHIFKIGVEVELPVADPDLREVSESGIPIPDLFFETNKGNVWVECQTANSQSGLSKKGRYLRMFPNAYSVFILAAYGQDSRTVSDLKSAVESSGKTFVFLSL